MSNDLTNELLHMVSIEIQAACHRAELTPLQRPHFDAALANIKGEFLKAPTSEYSDDKKDA